MALYLSGPSTKCFPESYSSAARIAFEVERVPLLNIFQQTPRTFFMFYIYNIIIHTYNTCINPLNTFLFLKIKEIKKKKKRSLHFTHLDLFSILSKNSSYTPPNLENFLYPRLFLFSPGLWLSKTDPIASLFIYDFKLRLADKSISFFTG